jgi:hypothetical protein
MIALNGFVSLINAMAWPLATLGLALLFRNEVKSMIVRLGSVKYREVEVTFRDDLHQAEVLARSIPAKPKVMLEIESGSSAPRLGGEIIGDLKPAGPIHQGIDRLTSRSPRDAVLEAWAMVGQALIKSASALGDRRAPAPLRPEDAARYLIDRGWLAGPEAQLIVRLRMLRDRVANAREITLSADDARRFVELALPMVSRIETLG